MQANNRRQSNMKVAYEAHTRVEQDLLRGRSVAAWLGESGVFGSERRRALQIADRFGNGYILLARTFTM